MSVRKAVAFFAVAVLAGCTPALEPFKSVLSQEDLGAQWKGPMNKFPEDNGPSFRVTLCGPLGLAWSTGGPDKDVPRSTSVWYDNEIVVRTLVDRYDDNPSRIADRVADIALVANCARDETGAEASTTSGSIRSFAVEQVEGYPDAEAAILTRERNDMSSGEWMLDTALVVQDSAVVGVEVSYPEGTASVPDVSELLDKALVAASEQMSSS